MGISLWFIMERDREYVLILDQDCGDVSDFIAWGQAQQVLKRTNEGGYSR